MMSAYHFKDESKIGAEYLRKIWRIYHKHVKITLCVTSKRFTGKHNYLLERRNSTNDRMLRYNMQDNIFFMDNVSSTKKTK